MKVWFVAFVFALFAIQGIPSVSAAKDVSCAACTLGVHLIEQVIVTQKVGDIQRFIETKLCTILPSSLQSTCQFLISVYGKGLIEGLINKENADVICHSLPFCDASPQCRLLPPKGSSKSLSSDFSNSFTYKASSLEARNPLLAQKIVEQVQAAIDQGVLNEKLSRVNRINAANKVQIPLSSVMGGTPSAHLPNLDLDGDKFSTIQTLRGSDWRGKDCADLDNFIYPGRKTNPYGKANDYNCNGISGTHPNGQPWKDVLCANSSPRGVGVIGDSAGAHFSIPPSWVTPSTINSSTYSNFFSVLADEFDFPQNSAYTAWGPTPPGSKIPLQSIYKEVVRRNKCNHRNYQNLAVNGGDSYNVQVYQLSAALNQTRDHPMLMFLELLGNDVCGSAHDFSQATPPHVFKANIMKILNTLDTQLPPGSHVVMIGLVDGRLLFDVLHDKPHPLGGGVTYTELYDFLNCVYANPCWGWLNSNSTVRDQTTAWAQTLNAQYEVIMAETKGKFKNFDAIYYDIPAKEIMDKWSAEGHARKDLIEAVDGFHPSQTFLTLLSDWLVRNLDKDRPHFLGPVNPQNDLITSIFGDQGGY